MRDRIDTLPMPDVPAADPAQIVPHFASVGALAAVVLGWLPYFVAVIPAVYYCILIWESKTIQQALWRRRVRRRARRIALRYASKRAAQAQVASGAKSP